MAPILPRTYAVGPLCHDPTETMRAMAAVLVAGPGAMLDGMAAATRLGTWNRRCDTIHVSSRDGGLRNPPPDHVFLRAPDLERYGEPLEHDGLPLAPFARQCFVISRDYTPLQVAYVICRGCYLGFVTLDDLDRCLCEHAGERGAGVLRSAVALVRARSAGTKSGAEDLLIAELGAVGLAPELVNVRGALGLSRDEPDLVWPSIMVNVEVDGGHHDDPGQAADDKRRDEEAAALGWNVLRVRSRDVWYRRRATVRRVVRFLEAARGVPRR